MAGNARESAGSSRKRWIGVAAPIRTRPPSTLRALNSGIPVTSISAGMSTSPARPSRAQGSVSVAPATMRKRSRRVRISSKASSSAVGVRYSSQWSIADPLRGSVLFRRHLLHGRNAAGLHHHFDRVLDAILGVANGGREIFERERVRVNLGCVEALLVHECFGAVGRALAFAANAVDVDVVAHDMRDIDRGFAVRKRREAYLATAIDHLDRFIERVRSRRAFEHIIDALAAVEPFDGLDHVTLLADVEYMVGAEIESDLQPIVPGA